MERCFSCGGANVVRAAAAWKRPPLALVASPRRHCLDCGARWRERHRLLPHDAVETRLGYVAAAVALALVLLAAAARRPPNPFPRLEAAARAAVRAYRAHAAPRGRPR